MMLGYAKEHGKGTYRVYKPSTKRVILSRDVIWQPFKSKDLGEELGLFEAGVTEASTDSDMTELDMNHNEENKTKRKFKVPTTDNTHDDTDTESDSDDDDYKESMVNKIKGGI